jgi:hypothetical protein
MPATAERIISQLPAPVLGNAESLIGTDVAAASVILPPQKLSRAYAGLIGRYDSDVRPDDLELADLSDELWEFHPEENSSEGVLTDLHRRLVSRIDRAYYNVLPKYGKIAAIAVDAVAGHFAKRFEKANGGYNKALQQEKTELELLKASSDRVAAYRMEDFGISDMSIGDYRTAEVAEREGDIIDLGLHQAFAELEFVSARVILKLLKGSVAPDFSEPQKFLLPYRLSGRGTDIHPS